MGVVHTPICGQFVCGDGTRVSTWTATEGRPKLVLTPFTFSITITEGPLITLVLNRPKLWLNAKGFLKQTDTSPTFARSRLILRGKAFVIQPFLGMQLGRPQLFLRGKAVLLAVSVQLSVGKPRLILLGGLLARAGKAGLIPTIPQSRTLTPDVCTPETLQPTVAQSRTFVVTERGSRPLQPTTDTPDKVLVPSDVEVR